MTQRQFAVRTVIALALIAVGLIVAWLVHTVADILALLLVSAILAAGLAPVVGGLERCALPRGLRLSRGIAIGVLYLALFLALSALVSVIVIPAAAETAGFLQRLPDLLTRLRTALVELRRHMPWLPDLTGSLDRLPTQTAGLSRYGIAAAHMVFRFIGGVTSAIAVAVFTFYMLLEGAQMKRGFLALFPVDERPRVGRVLDRIGMRFGGWLRGQFVLSLTVAAAMTVGLLALGIPFAFLVGVAAGLGELIPMVGPALGGIVAFLVALSQPTWALVGVVVFYVILQNVESHILVPRIMARATGMSSLVTLVALLVGIKVFGILGALLAVPTAAALQVIGSEVIREIQLPEAYLSVASTIATSAEVTQADATAAPGQR